MYKNEIRCINFEAIKNLQWRTDNLNLLKEEAREMTQELRAILFSQQWTGFSSQKPHGG